MRFEVRAYADGRITSVIVEAVSQADAFQQVAAQSLRPLTAKGLGNSGIRWFSNSQKRFQPLLFSQELLALLSAGLSIIEAISTLAERERQVDSKSILDQLASRLREGKSFSGALETIPTAFPALFVGIIRSSERTGNVQEALQRFIDYRKRVEGLSNKVVTATIYPVVLITVAMAVSLFLGIYVIPRFAAVYQGSGRSLPTASAVLMQWGSFANAHLPILLAGLGCLTGACIVGWQKMMRQGGPAVVLHKMPLFRERVQIYGLARMYSTLSMLLDSGLPIIQALGLAEQSVASSERKALHAAAEQIQKGERLSAAFERVGLTSTVSLRMLSIGEESGRLGDMMGRAARFHDEETARWIEHFSKIAEPLLMVAIGIIIGTVVVLLYMPVFDLAGSFR